MAGMLLDFSSVVLTAPVVPGPAASRVPGSTLVPTFGGR